MHKGMRSIFTIIRDLLKGSSITKPDRVLPVVPADIAALQSRQEANMTWFGHSTILLHIEGKRILLDPIFSNKPSPFPFVGGKRFSKVLPVEPQTLAAIDAVILSHDHYDHMDYRSIMVLKDRASLFFAPAGVAGRLRAWGIKPEKIRECKWWDEEELGGLKLICTPARHFSGRGLFDRNKTLYSSWAIKGQQTSIYFSGDGGYGAHFAEIGAKYGPFDLALMECGQYDKRWSDIHMAPEETVQAHLDVKGKLLVPIHWAAFSLAFHSWTDPIERVTKASRERGVTIATPQIGEPVILGAAEYPTAKWWE